MSASLDSWFVSSARARVALAGLSSALPESLRKLATVIASQLLDRNARTAAISGPPGCGKTTLAGAIGEALQVLGSDAVILSLDDFYLTRNERERLGRTVHPLLRSRGVPGTHDDELFAGCLRDLLDGKNVRVPLFSKDMDDRCGWTEISRKSGPVIVEGWCVGARPEGKARLQRPCNQLERTLDPEQVWRRYVNRASARMESGWMTAIEVVVFLCPPDLERVHNWRLEQETERVPARRMSSAGLQDFLSPLERLVGWMVVDLPSRADIVVALGPVREVRSIRVRSVRPQEAGC